MSPIFQPLARTIGLVEASEKTLVDVTANAFDPDTIEFGCRKRGCEAANTHDGDLFTRWSCKSDLLDGTNCEITYTFETPQNIVRMLIAFFKGDERTRELNVKVNGLFYSVIESSGETDRFETFELSAHGAKTLTLESLGLRREKWISISEVSLLLKRLNTRMIYMKIDYIY